jgi:vesicle-fusing ATPase
MGKEDAKAIARQIKKPIGIKQLLMVAEMAKQGSDDGSVNVNIFMECLHAAGY